ncbi:MAG: site-specific integrase, partial [Clostridia bacterium]|nr:site-specific integrase [Clostridia bacterium]
MLVLLQDFLSYLRLERGAAGSTISAYGRDIADFLNFCAGRAVKAKEVDAWLIRAYLAGLSRKGLRRTTVARKIAALRSFYRYLRRRGEVAANPFSLVCAPRPEKHLPLFLYYQEVETLLRLPRADTPGGQRDRALLEVLYATGARVEEIVGLDLEDLHLEEGYAVVRGKGSKERVVLLGGEAQAAL